MPTYKSTTETPWTQSANQFIDTLNSVFDAQQKRQQMEIKNAYDRVKFAMDHGSGADYDSAVAEFNSLNKKIKGGINMQPRNPQMMKDYESSLQPKYNPATPDVYSPDVQSNGQPTLMGEPDLQTLTKVGAPASITPGAQPNILKLIEALTQGEKMPFDRAIQAAKLSVEDQKLNQAQDNGPYKIGQLVNDIVLNGKHYQGIYAGLNPDRTPRFVNLQVKEAEPYKPGQLVSDIQKNGKIYQGVYIGMNDDGTPKFANMQEKTESFKAKNVIGRGGVTKRPIMQDATTGNMLYADSFDKGVKEIASPEDTSQLRPTTVKGLEATQVSELANFKNTYGRLDNIEKKLADPKMANKTGPIFGRWEQLKVKFLNDGASQSVINELKSLITIAYGLSGKQISPEEMKLLQDAMLPRLEQPGENLLSTINFAKGWIKTVHNDRLDYFDKAFYDTNIKPIVDKAPEGNKIGRFNVEVGP